MFNFEVPIFFLVHFLFEVRRKKKGGSVIETEISINFSSPSDHGTPVTKTLKKIFLLRSINLKSLIEMKNISENVNCN